MTSMRNNRRAVEWRRDITLILSEDNDVYLKEYSKLRDETVGVAVSRMINLILNDMRALENGSGD